MTIEELQAIINTYNPAESLNNNNPEDNYVPLVALEQFLKSKQEELRTKIQTYEQHISKLFRKDCKLHLLEMQDNTPRLIQYDETKSIFLEVNDSLNPKNRTSIQLTNTQKSLIPNLPTKKKKFLDPTFQYYQILLNDPETKNFLEYYITWCQSYYDQNNVLTNCGLTLDIYQDELTGLYMVLSDYFEKAIHYKDHPCNIKYWETAILNLRSFPKYYNNYLHFYFQKNLLTSESTTGYFHDKYQDIISPAKLKNIYHTMQVDISKFPPHVQAEIKEYEGYYLLKLNETSSQESKDSQTRQREQLLEAYQKLKEAAELLNNLSADINLPKIKLNDLKTLFFKNNGKPNLDGYIEIDPLFKNNTLLRLIDLKDLDLTNVDIRNMDFSGTNIRFNPQQVYNKDLTNVNASGLKFSPFADSFIDTILDGTIITDWEANINLQTVKSYNNQTHIPTKKTNTL